MVFQRVRPFFCMFLLLGVVLSLPAQEDDEDREGGELPIESEWTGPLPTLYDKGDQTFSLNAGVLFPTVFFDNRGAVYTHNLNAVGGTGFLAYSYFLSSNWFIGGEAGGMFISTLMNNLLWIAPFGVVGGYQFLAGRFEFPLSLMLGMAAQQFLEKGHFSFLFIKPKASAYWRYNPDWSFGLNLAWWWVPQWPEDPSKNRYGNFIELTLSARYHF